MAEHIKGSVISSKNRDVILGKYTDILCPKCGIQSGEKLKIRSDIDGTLELECENCTYSEFKLSGKSR